ncbi:putative late blight resistance protein homolog R1A-3 [Nicotiana tabacum]|uniref:Late blight resistance protein homolog R1A-3 n=8 Tax=Nicotiana TaxID=4085 RepID=A0A1S4A2Z3_TOBAC|nr:PREDICTED: putative late blight resistance protein homolog R1A-3 [Nicotiana sylvestris]XP_009796761.1 PREDICTED: putative late blight resistance protein homolog R1A-3 [Nicotiana sylvestris]XP_009796762.1 PREDICTED: putative late blight resistance protein homolog R1A-3 [Nicotiana sylvestris]XP_009796763.1 PREDICTED: putative late blight resistance protein homolog R1A-3 [Nicotiana sylvestris]XP_009796764.1 PREDICTED: putative late blight resistance protein homolog R1A-3 [Nicotiana sylvestris]
MEKGKENEGEREKGEANNSLMTSAVFHKDIDNLLDFIERLKNRRDQIALDIDENENLTMLLKFMSSFFQLFYFIPGGLDAEKSCMLYEFHGLVQSLFHQNGDDMLRKLTDDVPTCLLENMVSCLSSYHNSEPSATMTEDQLVVSMTEDQLVVLLDALLVYLHDQSKLFAKLICPLKTEYEVLQNVCGNLRDFHGLKVNNYIEYETIEYVLSQFQLMAERVKHFCFAFLAYHFKMIADVPQVKLAHLLLEIVPVQLEVMHICCTNLKASKSAEVGHFKKQLLEASPDILREYLIHLQEHRVNVITLSTSAQNIYVMIEFLLIILTDLPKDIIHHDKLFVFLSRVATLTREVSILVRNTEENSRNEENTNETSYTSLDLRGNIEFLKEDLKYVFLKAPVDSQQLCFPNSDGSLFMNLLLINLNGLLNSNAYAIALIKEEIGLMKEYLQFIRLFFGNVEQELNRDLWTRVLDVAYEAEHVINSILVRDHGLLHLIFLLPDTVEKIKLIKKEVQENMSLIVVNSPNKQVERKPSKKQVGQIIVGFEEEKNLLISQLTNRLAELDVISIIGMPGAGKTTLAYKVFNDKSVTSHFDIRAWCTVDQEYDSKKVLHKFFNQVTGLDAEFTEDFDVYDELRKTLHSRRYLIVLDDLWDTKAWDELTMPFHDFQKGSRIILTSREKKVALHGKRHSDPLNLRLLRQEESWELLEKKVFGEESCPDELRDVGEEIALKCDGLPLALDLIGGIIAKMEKKEDLWLEVLNNLKSFKNEGEVMEVIELSYDHLLDHLKPCLLYLASYPKDTNIQISQLNDLWSAEGFAEQNDIKSVEEVSESYVDELISSSLVILFNERGISDRSIKIHDLVHDFCSRKAEKKNLLGFVRSRDPSSFSDLMPRGMIIHYDHSEESFVLFSPEKKNPYVKHLLSLKVDMDEYGMPNKLPENCHLRHLRLLTRLELLHITLTDSTLNEIGMLVHLRCLNIRTEARAFPPSFANLLNLETLVVDNGRSLMVISPSIWSLPKLRHVSMNKFFLFEPTIDKPTVLEEELKLENLRILHKPAIFCLEDRKEIFKRFPNLRNLKFSITIPRNFRSDAIDEEICFPRLDVLNELEEVSAYFSVKWHNAHQWDFHFPLSLKKLELRRFDLTSDSLSRIARLPNLQKLCLHSLTIQGKEWNAEEVTFHSLKSLKLAWVSFSEWQVGEESFPVLEELQLRHCTELTEIPDSFGDIPSLKSIALDSNPQLEDSALRIKEYVSEMTGKDKLELK